MNESFRELPPIKIQQWRPFYMGQKSYRIFFWRVFRGLILFYMKNILECALNKIMQPKKIDIWNKRE